MGLWSAGGLFGAVCALAAGKPQIASRVTIWLSHLVKERIDIPRWYRNPNITLNHLQSSGKKLRFDETFSNVII